MRSRILIASFAMAAGMLSLISPRPLMAQGKMKTSDPVRTIVQERLARHGILKDNDVRVDVGDSAITLDGTVSTLYQKREAVEQAGQVDDNYRVIDHLAAKSLPLTDQQLAANVTKRFQDNVFYSIFDWVNIAVKDGSVALTGWVDEPWHKRQFEHEVERVPGVTSIENKIQIESGSLYDDEIRNKAARLIYDDPSFQPYSDTPGAPIHIIVNNGKVTLEGTVAWPYMRNWAQNTIYMNTEAFDVIDNLRVEGQ